VILDANERRNTEDFVSRDLVMGFYTNVAYRLILQENNVFVFARTNAPSAVPSSP
jgi:hypothetical protein